MISAARPLTESFALAYALDPAFDLERFKEEHGEDKGAEEFMHAFDRCVEAQDYSSITKVGQSPTLFHFRALKFSEVDRILSMQLGGARANTVMFRLCLKSIEDPSLSMEIKRTTDPEFKSLGPMVSEKWLDDLAIKVGSFEFVHFLGNQVFLRSRAPSPK